MAASAGGINGDAAGRSRQVDLFDCGGHVVVDLIEGPGHADRDGNPGRTGHRGGHRGGTDYGGYARRVGRDQLNAVGRDFGQRFTALYVAVDLSPDLGRNLVQSACTGAADGHSGPNAASHRHGTGKDDRVDRLCRVGLQTQGPGRDNAAPYHGSLHLRGRLQEIDLLPEFTIAVILFQKIVCFFPGIHNGFRPDILVYVTGTDTLEDLHLFIGINLARLLRGRVVVSNIYTQVPANEVSSHSQPHRNTHACGPAHRTSGRSAYDGGVDLRGVHGVDINPTFAIDHAVGNVGVGGCKDHVGRLRTGA